MAKDYEDGVWRTIGGRRIFIKDGQSMSDAMKESGKFKKEALGKGLKDLEQKEPDSEGAKKLFDEDEKKAREVEWEKNIEEQYNRFHGKTDEQIANEIAKERGERILTDEEQKAREVQFMKNLEKEVDKDKNQNKALGKGLDDLGKEKLDGEGTKKLFDDNLSETGKSTLINEYNKTGSRGSMSDDAFIEQARKAGMSDENIAKEVYKKHNGPESNNTSDNNIKRLLAKQGKEEALASGNTEKAEMFEKYENRFAERVKPETNGDDKVKTLSGKYETDNKGREVTQKEYDEFRQAYKDGKISQEDYRNDNYDALKNITEKSTNDTMNNAIREKALSNDKPREIKTFKGNDAYDRATRNGYLTYHGDDLSKGGHNYEKIANKLMDDGYKVRVYEEATRVRGLHNYTVLYKKDERENNITNTLRRKAYQKYLKEHPNSKMKFEDFIKE